MYPVTVQEQLPNDRYPQSCARVKWTPVEMLDLRRFKKVVVSYSMHSPSVQQMLKSWPTCNRIIPQDWRDLVTAVLEPGPQLQWRTWWKEEAKTIEQQSRTRGMKIFQDQLLVIMLMYKCNLCMITTLVYALHQL